MILALLMLNFAGIFSRCFASTPMHLEITSGLMVNSMGNTTESNITSLQVRVISSSSLMRPLSNATVILQDSAGRIALRGRTDKNGYVRFDSIQIDNYTIFVEWLGAEVFSGKIDSSVSRNVELRVSVFEVILRLVDPFRKPLPHSTITVKRTILRRAISGYLMETQELVKMESDENGYISCLLPSGTYEISCSSGIYSGKINVNLTENYSGTLWCNVEFRIWILLLLISLPLSLISLLLERRKLRRPLEYRRYQSMLLKLESMYNSGLVEYKIYRKLKEEYETKLMELGGRRGR
ncbi:MAG: carboxypeptidase-like regulatory domain-containing protein [Candidatus Bathyarchaeia archaeon]